MKILIIQLARFGDVFLTCPTLKALKRQNPEVEIHVLVRQRFAKALEVYPVIDRLWQLETEHILKPILEDKICVEASLSLLEEEVKRLQDENFDVIVNLSFSPFSSYLTSLIQSLTTKEVRGYTRTRDGFLSLPDDPSAYFYAQVGVGLVNRYHLGEIFAAVANVDLLAEDWEPPLEWTNSTELQTFVSQKGLSTKSYIVIHLGASQTSKCYPIFKWRRVLQALNFQQENLQLHLVLLGSQDEEPMGQELLLGSCLDHVINLIGKTTFQESWSLINQARLYVGCDSAPLHLAGWTKTPCLNLSFANVNFWETGPRVIGSRIIFAENPESLPSDRVVREIQAMLLDTWSGEPVVVRDSGEPIGFVWKDHLDDPFSWNLVTAIYSGGEWPPLNDPLAIKAMGELHKLVDVALLQISMLKDVQRRSLAVKLLEQSDVLISAIGKMVPDLKPLVSWFETERLRVEGHNLEFLLDKTNKIYSDFKLILDLYVRDLQAQRNWDKPIDILYEPSGV